MIKTEELINRANEIQKQFPCPNGMNKKSYQEGIYFALIAQSKAENLPISDVSHQRELLKAFLDWQQNNCTMPYDASISSQIEAWEAFNSD